MWRWVRTMKVINTFKRDSAIQVISCRPWTSLLYPYQSLARKMTYLELKDQVFNPPHPNPTYPERPNIPLPQIVQASRSRMTKESKKRSGNHQANRRQYKVRWMEKPLVISRALATLIPAAAVTTTTATPPTMSNSMSGIATWSSISSTTANLFVSNPSSISRTLEVPKPQIPRLWSRPYNKEDTPMPVHRKERKLDLSKLKNPPIREVANSCPMPWATDNPTMASITVTTSAPSPAKMCKRWGLPYLFCAKSICHPSQVIQTGQKKIGTEK